MGPTPRAGVEKASRRNRRFDIENGLPVSRIGNAAEKIPASRAGEILDEEDLWPSGGIAVHLFI
jgi:hypothetical protein